MDVIQSNDFLHSVECVTNEDGLLDTRGHDLTLIVMINRRVGLSLREAPLWGSWRRGYRDYFFSESRNIPATTDRTEGVIESIHELLSHAWRLD